MARLIDANELVKLLKANTMSNGTLINTNTMLAVVEKMPTAYDIEKVVEELGELPNREADHYYANSNDVIDREDAIDIVKRGGAE